MKTLIMRYLILVNLININKNISKIINKYIQILKTTKTTKTKVSKFLNLYKIRVLTLESSYYFII